MKKAIIVLLAIAMLAGCSQVNTQDMKKVNDIEKIDAETLPEDAPGEPISPELPESITIGGIIENMSDDQITLVDVEGLEGETSVIVNISGTTQWDIPLGVMKEGQYVILEVSAMMTRSIPPQTNAISILNIYDVILGEVIEIDKKGMTLKPVSSYYAHEQVVVLISDKTDWSVEKDSVNVGNTIRVMVGMQMTASIPPQVPCIEVISIETNE